MCLCASRLQRILVLQSKKEDLSNEMSDDEEKSASEGEEPVQTLAASRSRRDNAGKRFVLPAIRLDYDPIISRKQSVNKFEALKKLKEARKEGKKMNYEIEEVSWGPPINKF